jgi:hypothetical protein
MSRSSAKGRAPLLACLISATCAVQTFGQVRSVGDDEFEAALRRGPTTARAAPAGDFEAAVRAIPAPAHGTGRIPARWRDLKRFPTGGDAVALKADFEAGRVDPQALMAQIAGPLPLPLNARPAGCVYRLLDSVYTLGYEAPVGYLEALAAMKAEGEGVGKPATSAFMLNRSRYAETGTGGFGIHEIHTFLKARGYKRVRVGYASDIIYAPVSPPTDHEGLRITIDSSAFREVDRCARRGRVLPSGPLLIISYASAPGRRNVSE